MGEENKDEKHIPSPSLATIFLLAFFYTNFILRVLYRQFRGRIISGKCL